VRIKNVLIVRRRFSAGLKNLDRYKLLVPLPNRAKRNMAYTKPAQPVEQQSLLSSALDNKPRNV
jgi:hypothetical protein